MVPRTNITPAPYCKRCRFYHGAHRVVCSLHPYGPESKTCGDYASEGRELSQGRTSQNCWNIRQFHDWKRWQKILALSLLVGTFGFSCLLKWLAINPLQPTTKAIDPIQSPTKQLPKSGYLR